jgi:hypothetical protein
MKPEPQVFFLHLRAQLVCIQYMLTWIIHQSSNPAFKPVWLDIILICTQNNSDDRKAQLTITRCYLTFLHAHTMNDNPKQTNYVQSPRSANCLRELIGRGFQIRFFKIMYLFVYIIIGHQSIYVFSHLFNFVIKYYIFVVLYIIFLLASI